MVAEMITQYLLALRRKAQGEKVTHILAHPAFHAAMQDVQAKLRNGSAEWHTFEQAFADKG